MPIRQARGADSRAIGSSGRQWPQPSRPLRLHAIQSMSRPEVVETAGSNLWIVVLVRTNNLSPVRHEQSYSNAAAQMSDSVLLRTLVCSRN